MSNNNNNDDASDNNSEINHIEEVFNIQDPENALVNISTEIRIQGIIKNNESRQLILGLLDTGATGNFIIKPDGNVIQFRMSVNKQSQQRSLP